MTRLALTDNSICSDTVFSIVFIWLGSILIIHFFSWRVLSKHFVNTFSMKTIDLKLSTILVKSYFFNPSILTLSFFVNGSHFNRTLQFRCLCLYLRTISMSQTLFLIENCQPAFCPIDSDFIIKLSIFSWKSDNTCLTLIKGLEAKEWKSLSLKVRIKFYYLWQKFLAAPSFFYSHWKQKCVGKKFLISEHGKS